MGRAYGLFDVADPLRELCRATVDLSIHRFVLSSLNEHNARARYREAGEASARI